MWLKRITILLGLTGAAAILAACTGQQYINYDGKEQLVEDVEEIIADKLEVENPALDLDVSITQESEE